MARVVSSWPKVIASVMVLLVSLAACDDGPADVVEELEGTADGAGVVLAFDVVVEGNLPEGTPLGGHGLRVSVYARDLSNGGFSPGRVVDDQGLVFDNATIERPGPFGCDGSTCRARLTGFVPGVVSDELEYSIRVAYAPDGYRISPPDLGIDVIEARDAPVKELLYSVRLDETNEFAGAVLQLAAEPPIVDPPLGWLEVPYAEVWRSPYPNSAFGCLADGCEQASEVVFVNIGYAGTLGRVLVEGWLATEAEPILNITNETHRARAVTETARSVADEYRVTVEYPSREMGLPLMVNLEWAGDGFDEFFIDDDYAANRLQATAILADRCGGTSCTFRVARTSPSPNEGPPSELIVTVLPWESETNPDALIYITE